ncbi:MAG: SDR family NAD(P)-dependent oxidoreductase [Azospirillaceae bacterium]
MEHQNVLVTGAATGIGRASALAFASRAAHVIVTDIDHDGARAVADEIGGKARAFRLDVTDAAGIRRVFDEAAEAVGPITIVHANAGVSSMRPAVDLTEADWDFNFSINAKGVFLTNQAAVRHMIAHERDGAIVNTASLAAKVGAPLLAHYSASKFAVVGWTQALAREVAGLGIRVNAVCPGFVRTSMQDREVEWEAELRGMTADGVRRSYIEQTPLGRLEEPEDVADVVVFLASSSARFMTGQAINVTGGVYMT